MFKKYNVTFDFTALELRDDQQPPVFLLSLPFFFPLDFIFLSLRTVSVLLKNLLAKR